MRTSRLLATTLVVAGIGAAGAAVNAGGAPAGDRNAPSAGQVAECLGLACPDADHPVPEASGPAITISDQSRVALQTTAGFYEYGLGNPAWGKRAVAYVIPPGQADRMPLSIRSLPIVRSLATETTVFEDGSAVVIGDRNIYGVVPAAELKARATKSRRARARIRQGEMARAAGFGSCPNSHFCIYDFQNTVGEWWGLYGIGTGWLSLSACCNNFNDQAESMENARARDSLLNKHNPPQGGPDRYCADSNSIDYDLGNNIGRNEASMWANTDSDQQC
jgi:hypothetical protein